MAIAFRPCGPESHEQVVRLLRRWHVSAPGAGGPLLEELTSARVPTGHSLIWVLEHEGATIGMLAISPMIADAAIPDPRFRADLVLEPGARGGNAVRMARSFARDLAGLFGGWLVQTPMAAPSAADIAYDSRMRGEEAA